MVRTACGGGFPGALCGMLDVTRATPTGVRVEVRRGSAMNSWLQSMKQWTKWLMGEAPLPDGRSKAMLAGTVASAAVIAVGIPAAIPSTPSANAAGQQQAPTTGQNDNSSQYTVPPTSSTVAVSGVIAPGSPPSTTSPYYVQPGGVPTAPTLRFGGHKHHGRVKAAKAPPATPAAPVTAAPLALVPAPTPLIPIDPVPALVAPIAPPSPPLVTGAAPFVGSALVTWKAPAGSNAGGYDVFIGIAPGMEFPVPLNGATPVTGSSYLVTGLTSGRTYYFTVRGRTGATSSSVSNEVSAIPFDVYSPVGRLTGPVISMASTADGTGYWLATATGAVSPHGSAVDLGNTASLNLAAPIVKLSLIHI